MNLVSHSFEGETQKSHIYIVELLSQLLTFLMGNNVRLSSFKTSDELFYNFCPALTQTLIICHFTGDTLKPTNQPKYMKYIREILCCTQL